MTRILLVCVVALMCGCAGEVDGEVDGPSIGGIDAGAQDAAPSVAPVPSAVASYDCVASPAEEMGAAKDTSANLQIWLDGSQLYTCHSDSKPPCPCHEGAPQVCDCRTKDLAK